jgi:hypothetical protein
LPELAALYQRDRAEIVFRVNSIVALALLGQIQKDSHITNTAPTQFKLQMSLLF